MRSLDDYLAYINWDEVFSSKNIDIAVWQFSDILFQALNLFVSLIKSMS